MKAGYLLTDSVPAHSLVAQDNEVDPGIPEWASALLTPKQRDAASSLYRWRLALRKTDLNASVRSVARVISDHCGRTNMTCYPGAKTLAAETGLCKRTVRYAIRELEHRGFLRVERRRTGNRHHDTNIYSLTWPSRYVWKHEIATIAATLEAFPSGNWCTTQAATSAPPSGNWCTTQAATSAPEVGLEGTSKVNLEGVGDSRTSESEDPAAREPARATTAPKGQGQGRLRVLPACGYCGADYDVNHRGQLVPACSCEQRGEVDGEPAVKKLARRLTLPPDATP